jgi:hypothetical protein
MKITLDICATLLRTEITPLIRRPTPSAVSLPRPQENHSQSESEERLFKSHSPFVKYRSHSASASLMTPCTTAMAQGVTVQFARHGGDFMQVAQKVAQVTQNFSRDLREISTVTCQCTVTPYQKTVGVRRATHMGGRGENTKRKARTANRIAGKSVARVDFCTAATTQALSNATVTVTEISTL